MIERMYERRMNVERKEKTQINKIREDNVDITSDPNEIQKIRRHYFENLYPSKLENLEEIDTFLNT
jgi:hypothetical protein